MDKIEQLKKFIADNPNKSNNWYATHNGIVKRATFYKYLNEKMMDRSMDRSMDEDDSTDYKSLYEETKTKYENLQTDYISMKMLKEKYENIIHDNPYNQQKYDELEKKYKELQVQYMSLKQQQKPVEEPKKKDWYDEYL